MTKPVPLNLPHPSSGAYANARLCARMLQGVGGLYTLAGLSFLKNDDLFFGTVITTIGVGWTILGCDLYKGASNVENFHNKKFSTLHKVIGSSTKASTKDALYAATEQLFLQNVYRDFAEQNPKTFNNIQVFLMAKDSS